MLIRINTELSTKNSECLEYITVHEMVSCGEPTACSCVLIEQLESRHDNILWISLLHSHKIAKWQTF